MKRFLAIALLFVLGGVAIADDRSDDVERVKKAADALSEIMSAPDKGIPEEIITSAKCLAVIPGMKKGALGVGGQYGKGIASCRSGAGWSAPAFFILRGASFGFQIGGQSADIVMVIMNDKGMQNLLSSKFKLGADASVAAGPVGRHADASTDWKMRAEVLTYSRARGVFAGISLNGAGINQDEDDTRAFYGRMVPFKTILTGAIGAPGDAAPWMSALRKYSGAGVEKPK